MSLHIFLVVKYEKLVQRSTAHKQKKKKKKKKTLSHARHNVIEQAKKGIYMVDPHHNTNKTTQTTAEHGTVSLSLTLTLLMAAIQVLHRLSLQSGRLVAPFSAKKKERKTWPCFISGWWRLVQVFFFQLLKVRTWNGYCGLVTRNNLLLCVHFCYLGAMAGRRGHQSLAVTIFPFTICPFLFFFFFFRLILQFV